MKIASYMMDKEKLTGEYLKSFEKVEMYALVNNLPEDTISESLGNLVDIMLTAQEEGKPAAKITGNNLEVFCKSYFPNYSTKEKVLDVCRLFKRIVIFLLVFEGLFGVLPSLNDEGYNIMKATTEVSGFIFGVIAGCLSTVILKMLLGKRMFKSKKFTMNRYLLLDVVFLIASVIVFCTLLEVFEINIYIPVIVLLAVCSGYLLIYVLVYFVMKNGKGSSNENDIYTVKFGDYLDESLRTDAPKELKKRFDKINKKRNKKGQELMSKEEYQAMLMKEDKGSIIVCKLWRPIVAIAVVAFVAVHIFANGIDAIIPSIFGVSLGCIIFVPFMKTMEKASMARITLLKECTQKGITIIDMAENE